MAGSIFLTGHDPDFHATIGGNAAGARNIINAAINFVNNVAFNPFAAVGKLLFVESKGAVPGGHTRGVNGIVASGYTNGVDFDHHDFTTLGGALDNLGSVYSAIVVASDFGGLLRQAELDILNARSADIISFLNAGGGLFAMAEGNSGAHLTPNGGWFGYLPFVATSTAFNQDESGIAVTAFGAGLGLTNGDVNGNFSHNIFLGDFGLNAVDIDRFGQILSVAGRGQVDEGGVNQGVIPEPATFILLGIGMAGASFLKRAKAI
ncbi:MAG: PEP-CTERM sorting domain-containing protein [Candidatus Omnitrophica bacterium]|nr:PEP-CTERM sorting domain-containing protein [Candidatus Omnitrophota bacterium]